MKETLAFSSAPRGKWRMMVSAIADETLELLQLTLRRPTEHEQLGQLGVSAVMNWLVTEVIMIQ